MSESAAKASNAWPAPVSQQALGIFRHYIDKNAQMI
jgi:hypothetical protein